MAVPKKRTSSSKRNMRRAHDSLVAPTSIVCPQCGSFMQRHRACPSCGYYRGRKVAGIGSDTNENSAT
jgi:large subunit ribosomal protein L32